MAHDAYVRLVLAPADLRKPPPLQVVACGGSGNGDYARRLSLAVRAEGGEEDAPNGTATTLTTIVRSAGGSPIGLASWAASSGPVVAWVGIGCGGVICWTLQSKHHGMVGPSLS